MNSFIKLFIAINMIFIASCDRPKEVSVYLDPNKDVETRTKDLLKRMTLEEKIDMIGGYNVFSIRPSERLKIPEIKMSDGPLGLKHDGIATAFPAGIAMAASWNKELINIVGEAIGREARSKGVHIVLGPAINIHRAPMCGRNFEYYGEDPYLASRMAVAYINGIQKIGVCATVKHFAANNQEYDRHNISSDVDERTLNEIYFPAFKSAIEEGHVGAVMTSYNLLNGVHCSEHHQLIKEILKGRWKFDGFVVSDWGSTYNGIAAVKAGIDIEMPSGSNMNQKNLLPAISSGEINVSEIDDKVRRILHTMFRFGFFDRPQQDSSFLMNFQAPKYIALQAAREGIVLLKNSNRLLPLKRNQVKSIAIIGPNVHPAVTGGGGSSYVTPPYSVSVLDGITQVTGVGKEIFYSKGLEPSYENIFKHSTFYHGEKEKEDLVVELFSNLKMEGTPEVTRVDKNINFISDNDSIEICSKLGYSIRWRGKIKVNESDFYQFVVWSDDSLRLYIDNKLSINFDKDKYRTLDAAELYLKSNSIHDIRLEYYRTSGRGRVAFGWGKPDYLILPEVAKISKQADVAVVCVGFNSQIESEGFDRSFELPDGQGKLIREVANSNPKTVVVLTAGGNVDMTNWIDEIPVLIHSWYLGQEGGTALAEIIFGVINPSGKLPVSFERKWENNACYKNYFVSSNEKRIRYKEGIFLGYRHFDKEGITPMFPFGFGLSYTTFTYNNLTLVPKNMQRGQKLKINFDLTNSGKMDGAEIVQIYVSQSKSKVPRPVKELKRFDKVILKCGETKTLSFEIDESALSYYDVTRNIWVAEPDNYKVLIGSSSKDIRLTGLFKFK